MTSDELREELKKQVEREEYERTVGEYIRIRNLVRDAQEQCGDLSVHEVEEISLRIAYSQRVFDARTPVCCI